MMTCPMTKPGTRSYTTWRMNAESHPPRWRHVCKQQHGCGATACRGGHGHGSACNSGSTRGGSRGGKQHVTEQTGTGDVTGGAGGAGYDASLVPAAPGAVHSGHPCDEATAGRIAAGGCTCGVGWGVPSGLVRASRSSFRPMSDDPLCERSAASRPRAQNTLRKPRRLATAQAHTDTSQELLLGSACSCACSCACLLGLGSPSKGRPA